MQKDKYSKIAKYKFTSSFSFPMDIDSFKKRKSSFSNIFWSFDMIVDLLNFLNDMIDLRPE